MSMFSDLAKIVDLLRSALSFLMNIKTKAEREKTILDILKTYFLMKDIVDDGILLLSSAGKDPVKKISVMGANHAIKILKEWDLIVRKQGLRLFRLQEYIGGQNHLVIINPELKEKIDTVIGYKMDRTVTLHGIGVALFFKNLFPIEDNEKEKAKYVLLLLGAKKDGSLDIEKAYSEINQLQQSLKAYREVLERLVSKEELLSLSERARKETLMSSNA